MEFVDQNYVNMNKKPSDICNEMRSQDTEYPRRQARG